MGSFQGNDKVDNSRNNYREVSKLCSKNCVLIACSYTILTFLDNYFLNYQLNHFTSTSHASPMTFQSFIAFQGSLSTII